MTNNECLNRIFHLNETPEQKAFKSTITTMCEDCNIDIKEKEIDRYLSLFQSALKWLKEEKQ